MLHKIGFFCLFSLSLLGIEHVYLKTPNISRQEIIGTSVGIRPYRSSGVRLESEWFQDKLIIHNYGYGGSGLTLSFGGAKKVFDILETQETSSKVIAVLGAGVVGLTTAYDLLEKGYEVHIYSDEWSPNLTSNVAAGIWTPLSFPLDISEEKKDLHQQMLKIAEERFSKSRGAFPEFVGIKEMAYYRLITDQKASNTTDSREEVVVHFDNGLIKQAYRSYELAIDGKLFMEDLYAKVQSKGAVLHQGHFQSVEDLLHLKESTIINCMSLGSRQIFDDQEFIPVRGQLVYFQFQEGIDYLVSQSLNSDYFMAIYPWSDRLILGGAFEVGEETPFVIPEVIDQIIQNAEKCLSVEL